MSDSPAPGDRGSSSVSGPPVESGNDDRRKMLERVVPTLAEPIRRAGFWTAIVAPFLYFPVLFNGLGTWLELLFFLGLLSVNVLALYVGHTYRR
ncbi:hypothetical protein GRS80_00210 [Natrialba sp. INN-245]|nr:hypothetical protein [Natrialba sp. INN-245]MWV38250.1 hypothetical protein [Natrialba sp. INN-245]